MMTPGLQNTAIQNGTHNDSNDIKKIIFKILPNWYWFVLCLFICIGIAYAYNDCLHNNGIPPYWLTHVIIEMYIGIYTDRNQTFGEF